jgi:hypothetical protein
VFDSRIESLALGLVPELEKFPAERREELSRKLDIHEDEWEGWHILKSLGYARGLMGEDESGYLYRILGTGPEIFNGQDLSVKIVVTQYMVVLMDKMQDVAWR